MADMSKVGKSEFPSQTENRKQWILDTVRANQETTARILTCCASFPDLQCLEWARHELSGMHGMDRDALLKPGGILTDEQIAALTENKS